MAREKATQFLVKRGNQTFLHKESKTWGFFLYRKKRVPQASQNWLLNAIDFFIQFQKVVRKGEVMLALMLDNVMSVTVFPLGI